MSNDRFRFKKFVVEQAGAAMKVGTDGVLLGAWARVLPRPARYLDIGTGTGVIALMLAQRTEEAGFAAESKVDAVELDGDSAVQAAANAAASPWAGMVGVYCCGIRDFVPGCTAPLAAARGREVPQAVSENAFGVSRIPFGTTVGERAAAGGDPLQALRYDQIVSNPPWFVDALRSPHAGRSRARHTDSLPYAELLECAVRLLAPEGIFSVVLPAENRTRFLELAHAAGLGPNRCTFVRTLAGAAPKRVLLELAFADRCSAAVAEDTLTIETGGAPGSYTEEYCRLTGGFYLRF